MAEPRPESIRQITDPAERKRAYDAWSGKTPPAPPPAPKTPKPKKR